MIIFELPWWICHVCAEGELRTEVILVSNFLKSSWEDKVVHWAWFEFEVDIELDWLRYLLADDLCFECHCKFSDIYIAR